MNFVNNLYCQKMRKDYSLKIKHSNHILNFGRFGIKTTSFGRLTKLQMSSLNYFIMKIIQNFKNKKKSIKVWNFLFLNISLTKLNSESRMGKGKGSVYTKAVFLKPGSMLFELDGVSMKQTILLLNKLRKLTNLRLAIVTK